MLSVLAVLLCIPAALGQTGDSQMDASALRDLVVNSSAGLQSYGFSMQMDQRIDMVNQSSGEVQTVYMNALGRGVTDMADRAMKLSLAALSYGAEDEENGTAMALEEYMINDTIYIKMNGEWQTMQMAGLDPWSRQSTLERQIELFNNTPLTLIGSETVAGIDCYKVAARVDLASAMGMVAGEMNSVVPLASLNLSGLLGNNSLEMYYWIAKDTHNVLKTDIVEDLVINPQSMGLADEAASQEIRVSGQITMQFEGFNESVNIIFPAEALEAQGSAISYEQEGAAMDDSDSALYDSAGNESAVEENGTEDAAAYGSEFDKNAI